MTSPDRAYPPGSTVVGAFRARQTATESQGRAEMTGGVQGSWANASGTYAQEAKLPVEDHENRITILESGIQIAEFGSNGAWQKPEAPMNRHKLIAIGGAGGGHRKVWDDTAQPGAYGGGQGGWAEVEFEDVEVPTAMAVTIGSGGAGGTTDGAVGGVGNSTTIGSLLTAGGGSGGTTTPPNAGSGTRPEWAAHGGYGSNGYTGADPATAGGNGYLASGGAAGTTGGAGGSGVNVPFGKVGVGGGGGGGGGSTSTPGPGGPGGFPGGGGGGGGVKYALSGTNASGANGASGKAWVISYPTA